MKNSSTTITIATAATDFAWEKLLEKFESLSGKAVSGLEIENLSMYFQQENLDLGVLEEHLGGVELQKLEPELSAYGEAGNLLNAAVEAAASSEAEEEEEEEKLTYALFSEASDAFMEKAEKLGFEESFASELLAKEGLLSEEEALAWAKLEPEASKAFNLGKALEAAIEKEAF